MDVRKILLRSGVYQTPQGVLHATPSRVKGWADKYREMTEAGIKIPVCWGHNPHAWPHDPRSDGSNFIDADTLARRQYHLSAYNAGYLSGMDCERGHLGTRLDCPGVELEGDKLVSWQRLPSGNMVKCAIGEVSVAIKDWVDGTGKKWDDAIVHVALVPLPVAHGTGGFSLSTAGAGGICTDDDAPITLSLTGLLHTLSSDDGEVDMADDYDDEDTGSDKGGGKSGGSAKKDHFAECVEFLEAKGIHLPDDTTPANFFERLCIVGHALQEGGHMGEDADDAALDLDEPEPTDSEPAEVTGGTEGSTPAQEEQRPVMMSLSTAKTPAERGSIKRAGNDHKAHLRGRINRLVKKGMIRPALRADLEAELERYQPGFTLSTDEEMVPVNQRLDQRLSDLELSLIGKHPMKGMRTATVIDRPAPRSEHDARKEQEAAGDELAALAGVSRKR